GQDASVLDGRLDFSTSADEDSPPATYAITPSGLTAANYDITFVNGALTVTNLAVQVDSLDPTKSVLVVGGSAGDDVIRIRRGQDADSLRVQINTKDFHVKIRDTFAPPIDRII